MIDVMRFAFENFWHFLGTVILLTVAFEGIKRIINAIKK